MLKLNRSVKPLVTTSDASRSSLWDWRRLWPTAKSDELLALDMMRIIASLGIVLYHYREYLSGGRGHHLHIQFFTIWVDLFFVISGFVISYVYLNRIGSTFSFYEFLSKRIARLIPLHWATLLFYAALGGLVLVGVQPLSANRYDWGCFFPNALLLHAFGVCRAVSFNTVSWSISAEMAMYVLFPVFATALFRVRARGLFAFVLLSIVGLTMYSDRQGGQQWLDWASQFGCVRAIPSFVFGVALYGMRDKLKKMPVPKLVALASFGGLMVLGWNDAPLVVLLGVVYLLVASAAAIDLSGRSGPWVRQAGAWGQLTYSIYMLHLPVATVMMTAGRRMLHLHGTALDLWLIPTFALLMFVAAWSHAYFEQPMRHRMTAWLLSLRRRKAVVTSNRDERAGKVMVLIRSLEKWGGAQRAMARYATGLAERGFAVDVLVLKPNGPFGAELPEKVRVIPIAGGRLLFAVPFIARYLRRSRPDTVFSTEVACNVVVLIARILSGVRTRVVVREGTFPSISLTNSPHRAARFAYRLTPYLYPRADAVVVVAKEMAADLAKVARLPIDAITTIAVNPVVSDALIEDRSRDPHHPWLQPGEPPVILAVGRLEKAKDFATLIRAFERVREQRRCRLLILGEGGERAHLERIVGQGAHADDIELFGFVAQPYAYMGRCAVFVLSSLTEGLPNVLIEALACGAPVVATDCRSGPADVLEGGLYGALVPVGDDAAMAAAIAATLDCPPDRDRQARRGMDFTIERSVDLYLPVLFPGGQARPA